MKKYEYSDPILLKGEESKFITIPKSLITDTSLNNKRISVFSYFWFKRGLDEMLMTSVKSIVNYYGYSIKKGSGCISNQISDLISIFADKQYLSFNGELKFSSLIDFKVNTFKKEYFAVLYLDELNLISKYNNLNTKALNNSIILLVFVYIRMIIVRRGNQAPPEQDTLSAKERRELLPEAYNCYQSEIAEKLGLSASAVSKSIAALNELGLIYSEALPRFRVTDKRWKTSHTIFCNRYKREKNKLLAIGEDYYMTEIENKKQKIGISKNKWVK